MECLDACILRAKDVILEMTYYQLVRFLDVLTSCVYGESEKIVACNSACFHIDLNHVMCGFSSSKDWKLASINKHWLLQVLNLKQEVASFLIVLDIKTTGLDPYEHHIVTIQTLKDCKTKITRRKF